MRPRVILSLFDRTGNWARPWADAGHEVIALDTAVDGEAGDIRAFSCEWLFEELQIHEVDGILAAPPCTEFTVAGAQYWKRKDRDGTTAAACELVRQVLRCVELYAPDFWAIENPRAGRLAKLVPEIGAPEFTFDPCDFAQLSTTVQELEQIEALRARLAHGGTATRADADLVLRTGTYTKRTALFGSFLAPQRAPIAPVRVCAQGSPIQRFGGKSDATKAARSSTPEGFAEAFYRANEWTPERTLQRAKARRDAWAAEHLHPRLSPARREAEILAEFGPLPTNTDD